MDLVLLDVGVHDALRAAKARPKARLRRVTSLQM
jgi:hypothetical protein